MEESTQLIEDDDTELQIETYEELRERMSKVEGHRHPCAMDW